MGKTRNTGDLSADNILTVDITNDRVGVKNTSPSHTLDVTGDINYTGVLRNGGSQLSLGTDLLEVMLFC